MRAKPPNAGKGRPKGVPNKTTADVRKAFQMLVEENLDGLREWLASVAGGIKESHMDENGKPICNDEGEPIMNWLINPDPAGAFKLVLDLAEYHIPKLARIEHAGTVKLETANELTDDQLARIATSGSGGTIDPSKGETTLN